MTTYRIDGAYLDGRHPESVEFSSNLVEDLKRRDFTINAMAYNEQQGLVDVFEGIEDMQRKVIRCVGNPKERFGEDALRMMRAIRFSAQLGFEIEEKTYRAVEELAPTLEKVQHGADTGGTGKDSFCPHTRITCGFIRKQDCFVMYCRRRMLFCPENLKIRR